MENTTRTVEVKELPEMTVAYVRHVGPYAGDGALFERLYGKLFQWAGPRNLVQYPLDTLVIYHDSPDITDEDKLRISVCLPVPEGTPVDGEIGSMKVPGGRYAMAQFRLGNDEYQEAWNWIFSSWLPESGFEPDDRPCFEMYHDEGGKPEDGKCDVNICIPVRPV